MKITERKRWRRASVNFLLEVRAVIFRFYFTN